MTSPDLLAVRQARCWQAPQLITQRFNLHIAIHRALTCWCIEVAPEFSCSRSAYASSETQMCLFTSTLLLLLN